MVKATSHKWRIVQTAGGTFVAREDGKQVGRIIRFEDAELIVAMKAQLDALVRAVAEMHSEFMAHKLGELTPVNCKWCGAVAKADALSKLGDK